MNSAAKDHEEINKFLQEVDNVDTILKGLISDDSAVQAEAIAKADKKIAALENIKKKGATEIGFDRSCINKNAYNDDVSAPGPAFTEQNTSQEAFLASLEADSQRRAKERKERHRKAGLIKENGNKAFEKGNFQEAVDLYTEAMSVAKDLTPLYTNRAAAYFKLEQYENVISDCDFALRIDENWIKAFIYKAKALLKLKKFDEAASEFQTIVKIDKTKANLVSKYLSEVEKDRNQYSLETLATKDLAEEKEESVILSKLIKTLSSSEIQRRHGDNNLMYFVGGLQVMQEHIIDEQSRTLFRTQGGFDLFLKNGVISKCLKTKFFGQSLFPHCAELVSAFLSVCTAACLKMDENLKVLFSDSVMPDLLVSFLSWPEEQVKQNAIVFFHEVSLTKETRSVLYSHVDLVQLSFVLFKPNVKKAVTTTNAAATLCNLALDAKYCKLLCQNINSDFVGVLKDCLVEVGQSSYDALTLRMSYLTRIADKLDICKRLALDTCFYQACISSLVQCVAAFRRGLKYLCALTELLRLLRCILKVSHEYDSCKKVVVASRSLILKAKSEDLLVNALSVIGVVLELQRKCVDDLFFDSAHSLLKQLLGLTNKNLQLRTHAVKILCCVGQARAEYLHPVIKLDKNFETLRTILLSDSQSEEINQGHVALIFGALSTLSKGLEPILEAKAEGDVVRKLLVLCRDSKNKQVCANCAIALGKLSVANQRFLVELREHDGINILSRLKSEDIVS